MRSIRCNMKGVVLVAAVFLSLNIDRCIGYFNLEKENECFCNLQGKVDECSCNIDTVDYFNNVKIYPRLKSLLEKDYFRYFKVNLKRECPFWVDDSKCSMRFCNVESCGEKDLPPGLKGIKNHQKYTKEVNEACNEVHSDYDDLDTTLSEKAQKDIDLWNKYDDATDNFCIIDENDSDSEYVDLLRNPERYTGYKGKSAHRIWQSIYLENCFRPKYSNNPNLYIQNGILNELCLEERVFYRAISGLHASINTHLSAIYLLSDNKFGDPKGVWGPNLQEFQRRFSAETTNGEGPNWLRNLYFVYLLELRALAKAAPYLEKEEFYTGNENEDWDTQMAIKDLLGVISQFPDPFDEKIMFNGDKNLKYEFREHFRNVSRIMDCVGCAKCKVWGKLQTQGLGTALKILFSGKFDNLETNKKRFHLQRNEIVALVNAIGRLSTSIYKLDDFKNMINSKTQKKQNSNNIFT